jgi:hypothetical protein
MIKDIANSAANHVKSVMDQAQINASLISLVLLKIAYVLTVKLSSVMAVPIAQ